MPFFIKYLLQVLREYYPNLVSRVVARGAVFARMTSDQKQQLIVEYQALGYYVGTYRTIYNSTIVHS